MKGTPWAAARLCRLGAGGAAVTRTLSDGRVETIDYKYPGDHFGEGGFVSL